MSRVALVVSISLCLVAGAGCAPKPVAPPPAVLFSSFVGGELWDAVRDVDIDEAGFIYVAGGTRSARPLPGGGPKASPDDSNDAFVAKLDPMGQHVIWSKTFGGPGYDQAYALEVAPDGGILVAGRAGEGFPTTPGAAQRDFQGGPPPESGRWYGMQDGFVLKLSTSGDLQWSTYVGCARYNDFVRDVAVTPDGAVVVGTANDGSPYPRALADALVHGPHSKFGGGARDAVLAVLAPDGGHFEWASYVGGPGDEWAEVSVRSDAAGNVVLLTVSDRAGAPTLSAVQPDFGGERDFYLAKFSRAGVPIFATYFGGSGGEHIEVHNLAIAPDGDVVIAGGTESDDYPVSEGAFQRRLRGIGGTGTGHDSNYSGDVVVSRISPDGARLIASTYVGGTFGDSAEGVAVDAAGRVFVTGATFSRDFPTLPPMVGSNETGTDGFALALSPRLDRLIGSVVLGGAGSQAVRAAAVSSDGRKLVVGGTTQNAAWPVRAAFDPRYSGVDDGTVAGLDLVDAAPVPAPGGP